MSPDKAEALPDRYRDAGVGIDRGEALVRAIAPLARATARPGAAAALGGFGAVVDPRAAGFVDPLIVATTDGVGTKLLVALAADRLEGLGTDLVAMCVNDLLAQGATPLAFLDYLATGRLEVAAATRLIAGIAEGCRLAGCALVGGETAEMPGLYAPGHLDLAGFALGAVERGRLLPRHDLAAGDVLIGLPSAGLHANGFSLVREVVAGCGLALGDPAPFSPATDLGTALLHPTRIYVRGVLAALATGGVKALAHITGGGLPGNVPRLLRPGLDAGLTCGSWPVPPVYAWLREAGGLDRRSMLRTFNMGLGMVLAVDPALAGVVRAALADAGEQPMRVGQVIVGGGEPQVVFDGLEGWWPDASPS